jgi:hypothetical protein
MEKISRNVDSELSQDLRVLAERLREGHGDEIVADRMARAALAIESLHDQVAEMSSVFWYGVVRRCAVVLKVESLKEVLPTIEAIVYAAHMPEDYKYGLPSWIQQHLYMSFITDNERIQMHSTETIRLNLEKRLQAADILRSLLKIAQRVESMKKELGDDTK